MNSTLESEVKQLEVIEIGSRSPIRYLPMTEFVSHDELGDDFEEDEDDLVTEADRLEMEADDCESDDRSYYSSLYDLEAA